MSKLKKRRESAREARAHRRPRFRVFGGPKNQEDAKPRSFMGRVGSALLRKALRRAEPVTDMVGLVSDHVSELASQARTKVRALLGRPAES